MTPAKMVAVVRAATVGWNALALVWWTGARAVEVGNFEDNTVFNGKNFKSAQQIRDAAKKYPKREWAGFQL